MPDTLQFASMLNKTAVVTGASSGIGQAIAVEFARAGADVIVHYRQNRAGAERTAEQVEKYGQKVVLLAADLANIIELEQFAERIFHEQVQVDCWVNNAGVDLLTGAAREWSYAEKLQKLMEIDVRATALLSRRAGEFFFRQQRGCILNIGWDQAERGMEGDSGELFATAKNAIMGLSRSLALSWAPHVRVNCIAPGWIKTSWGEQASQLWQDRVLAETPLKRWGLPEDIAKMARFLCSEEAAYLTGQVFYVNGGAER